MKNEKTTQIFKVLFILALIIVSNELFAQGTQTASKIDSFYTGWAKPVVHGICALLTIGAAVRAIYKIYFQQQQAPAEIVMFIVGLIFWALWGVFANDLLAMGNTSYKF